MSVNPRRNASPKGCILRGRSNATYEHVTMPQRMSVSEIRSYRFLLADPLRVSSRGKATLRRSVASWVYRHVDWCI